MHTVKDMSSKKRILVIGAGASGLVSIKACKEENLEVVCYEKSGYFGGLWRYRDDKIDGVPSVMKSTVSNTSKEMSSFSDYPAPSDLPAYLPNHLVVKYLQMYAEHFDILSCVIYHHEIIKIVPADDYDNSGRWVVTVRDINLNRSREEVFDGVMVCSGHHVYPSIPSFPGLDTYTGTVLHSHKYKTLTGMENKVVVVVGAGNSGADIAVELTHCASKVFLSTRRGTWVFPRMMDRGKPFDILLVRRINGLFPTSMLTSKLEKLLDSRMDHGKFGIKPHHRATSQTPTISDDLHAKILTGMVTVKGNIKTFTETGVVFDNEADETPVDVVIFATGYDIKYPFISEDVLKVSQNKVSLYKQVFPPELQHPTLGIIGLLQPNASLFPVFEMQARWFVQILIGNVKIPNADVMIREIKAAENLRALKYVQSPRHTVEVNWMDYMDDLGNAIGVKPNLFRLFFCDPKLFWACVKGPCLPYQYRLNGPHAWDSARNAILTYKDRLYHYLKRPVSEKNLP